MRILIDINHPAQVHKLKNLIKKLGSAGHKLRVLSRDKEMTLFLLRKYGIKNHCISTQRKSKYGLIIEFFQRLFLTFFHIFSFRPKVMLGFSAFNLCLLGKILRIETVLFADTENAGAISKLTFPFASKIFIPKSFSRSFGSREIRFDGTHELSYLKNYTPDPLIYNYLKISDQQKYVLLRFVSWNASHDINESGLNLESKLALVNMLSKHFKVFISSEGKLPASLQKYKLIICPSRIHDVLYFADIFIGESQSMSTEAALLGTPSIRFSSLVGKMHGFGQYQELAQCGLLHSTNNEEDFFKLIKLLIKNKNRKIFWKKKSDDYVGNKTNPTEAAFKLIVGSF